MRKLFSIRFAGITAAVFLLLILSLYYYAVTLNKNPSGTVGEVRIELREYHSYGNKSDTYERGLFFVPENRNDPKSRVLAIHFARFKAKDPQGPPVFILPGGPGNTFIDADDDLWLSKVPKYTNTLRAHQDVILVDQRGYNNRGEVLYGFMDITKKIDQRIEDDVNDYKQYAQSVVESYQDSSTDLRGYNIFELVDDVNDLRQFLGYEKIMLMGQSFGSQWCFAVMKQYPEIVERAILSGVEPLNHTFDRPTHVFNAVKKIWNHIDEDPAFAPYLPPGGMAEAAETVITRLEDEPIEVKANSFFGFGSPTTVRIVGKDDFPWNNPTLILELYHGHTNRWANKRYAIYGYSSLIFPLVDSSMGITEERKELIKNDPAKRYIPQSNFAKMTATAEIWPSPDIGDEFRLPVQCDIPVVFAHGDWDMNTPIENTYEITPYFPNSHILHVTRGGHDVLPPMMSEHPDAFAEIIEFAKTGSMEGIPETLLFKPSKNYQPPKFQMTANDANER